MTNKFVVEDPPKQDDLRVWHVQNVPNKPITYDVGCQEEAIALLDALIDIDLKDPKISDNAFGMEEYDEDFGWTEWYDDDGDDVMQIIREMDDED